MGTLDNYVKTIKSGATSIGTSALMAAIIAEAPIFANPILHTILETILEESLGYLLNKTEFGAFFVYVDLRVTQQGRDFFDAVVANTKAKAKGSAKEQADAQKNLLRKFTTLVLLTS